MIAAIRNVRMRHDLAPAHSFFVETQANKHYQIHADSESVAVGWVHAINTIRWGLGNRASNRRFSVHSGLGEPTAALLDNMSLLEIARSEADLLMVLRRLFVLCKTHATDLLVPIDQREASHVPFTAPALHQAILRMSNEVQQAATDLLAVQQAGGGGGGGGGAGGHGGRSFWTSEVRKEYRSLMQRLQSISKLWDGQGGGGEGGGRAGGETKDGDSGDGLAHLKGIPEKGNEFDRLYTIGKKLGSGAFSFVHTCIARATKKEFAVKVIVKRGLPPAESRNLRQEVQLIQEASHSNIVEFIGFYDEPAAFYIVTELMTGGEVRTWGGGAAAAAASVQWS
jgi:hypothetical protein